MSIDNLMSNANVPRQQSITVYFCGRQKCTSGQSLGPVVRPQYVFYFVTSGKGIFRYKNVRHRLAAGQGFMAFPGEIFALEADADEPWEYLWVSFDGTDAIHIAEDMGLSDKRPLYKGDVDSRVEIAMNKLVDAYFGEKNDKYSVLSLFYACVGLLQDAEAVRHHGDKSYIEKSLDYIHHNYTYRIRIEDLARFVALDRTYLFKLFVRAVGMAPQEYLIRYRLNHAVELLKNTDMTTHEIAASCGFRDAPSFCKHFKNRFETSPIAYRKQLKEEA